MTPLLKRGNGSKDRELAEDMRAALLEMQQERSRYQALIETGRASADRLQQLGEPIAQAGSQLDAVAERLSDLEQRFAGLTQLSTHVQGLEERASEPTVSRKRAAASPA